MGLDLTVMFWPGLFVGLVAGIILGGLLPWLLWVALGVAVLCGLLGLWALMMGVD